MTIGYLRREQTFAAAHHYRLPWLDESEAERLFGPLNIHGHNYVLHVTIRGEISDDHGMVENLKTIKSVIVDRVITDLDRKFLNDDIAYFKDKSPTLENLAGFIWGRLEPAYPNGALHEIRITEEPELYLDKKAGSDDMFLTRGYHFCAAHRLHQKSLSEAENRALFGKCTNPSGHGHNYRVEVTIKGAVDERTGTICNIRDVDKLVDEKVIDYLDHMHLNCDIPEFASMNPTAENIARVIWERLGPNPGGAALHRVRLHETDRNVADYYGE